VPPTGTAKRRKNLRNGPAGLGTGSDNCYFSLRMSGEEPEEFSATITVDTDNSNFNHCAILLSFSEIAGQNLPAQMIVFSGVSPMYNIKDLLSL